MNGLIFLQLIGILHGDAFMMGLPTLVEVSLKQPMAVPPGHSKEWVLFSTRVHFLTSFIFGMQTMALHWVILITTILKYIQQPMAEQAGPALPPEIFLLR